MPQEVTAVSAQVDRGVRPRAWLCELAQEDGTTRTQFVEQDPDGLRWNDAGEPSPYRTTPLYEAPRWVPVAERLPVYKDGKTYVECIVRCDSGNVTAMVWTHNPTAKTEKGRQPRWEWNWRTAPWTVTHWMPMPEPPPLVSTGPNVRAKRV